MTINNVEFVVPLEDIFDELRAQLITNNIQLLDHKRVSGNNIQCSCPFHKGGQERKPSFGISTKTGIGHCFTCGEVREFPEIVSFCFGKKDNGAFGWEWLRRNFLIIEEEKRNVSISIKRGGKSKSEKSLQKSEGNLRDTTGDTKFVSDDELDSYRYYHPYWRKRGIVDENIIELFDLGYDKDTKCITMPVRDTDGNCLFVARRSVQTKFFNYPKGVSKPLYGLYELHHTMLSEANSAWSLYQFTQGDAKDIFICESIIDCILLWQSGRFAVALNGIGNQLQMKQLNELPCRTLILATDNDQGGDKAKLNIRKYVKRKLIKEAILPANRKDIGEMTEEEIKNLEVVYV